MKTTDGGRVAEEEDGEIDFHITHSDALLVL